MKELPTITSLINSFGKLPGVGVKSAERMAYAILSFSKEDQEEFSKAILAAGNKIHHCPICGLYTEDDKCEICSDMNRDHTTICVVSEPKDAIAIEKMNAFHGVYHVLGGLISLSKGIGCDSLHIDSLLMRVKEDKVKEVILATNPTLDGETTAMYVAKLLEGKGVTVTRLGYGLPMGSSLDYADSLTLSKAFEGRKKI
ncbi:MAG: recombination mediator RecR [Bacilli bacterium]|jgi:recombination protein RecR|nr:recombination mediator RecR [Bacilli bacterium]MCH4210161.1 recombination mediator RecR [Bacilli bacterium]MCH4229089.1 recombination mediator RecR [Bacilli bacterium]MCH4278259.1 recombination mediator RecR [Bacilli bacterium]MCI2055409.1 recombination mediator RecR [Bacilli bacterium]